MASEGKQQNEFTELLKKYKISDILPKDQRVVTVTTEQTPMEAFKHIVDHNILSAPVFDTKSQHYIGFLDVRDLVSFIVFEAEEHKKEVEGKEHNLHTLFDSAAKMYQKPIDGITVAYMAKRNKFVSVYLDDELIKVAEFLSSPQIHRVAVISHEKEQVIGIISQLNIIQFLYHHRESLQHGFSKTIEETHLGSRPVIPVTTKSTALDTLKLMTKYNKSGIAVVDPQGRLVGNTSGSDLKIIAENPARFMKALNLPILDFLSLVRQLDVSDKIKSPTISVTEHDSIGKVVGKLSATKVHRVFCADDATGYKPTAVISITDVLNFILHDGVQQHQ